MGRSEATNIWNQMSSAHGFLAGLIKKSGENFLQMGATPRYFISAVPKELNRSGLIDLKFETKLNRQLAECILNSNMFYWFWRVIGDGFHLTKEIIGIFPVPRSNPGKDEVVKLSNLLKEARPDCTTAKLNKGKYCYNVNFNLKPEVMIALDIFLGRLLGFSEAELDFIINYDIKYRINANRGADTDSEED